MNDSPRIRLFIAVPAPDAWQSWLRKAQQQLERELPGHFRWTNCESWHITVHFLGAQPKESVPSLRRTVRDIAAATHPFTLAATELGAPGARDKPRLVWLRCDDQGVLADAQRALLARLSPSPTASPPFRAHITLGRTRRPSRIPFEQAIAQLNTQPPPLPASVSELVLFRSHLEPKGARYEALERARLSG